MLIKVGRFYLTLGTFTLALMDNTWSLVIHSNNGIVPLNDSEAAELCALLDSHIASQITLQQQIEAVNAKAAQLAQYEQDLMQKAAQVEQAHAALNNKVVGVGAMPAFPGNGGRKR